MSTEKWYLQGMQAVAFFNISTNQETNYYATIYFSWFTVNNGICITRLYQSFTANRRNTILDSLRDACNNDIGFSFCILFVVSITQFKSIHSLTVLVKIVKIFLKISNYTCPFYYRFSITCEHFFIRCKHEVFVAILIFAFLFFLLFLLLFLLTFICVLLRKVQNIIINSKSNSLFNII